MTVPADTTNFDNLQVSGGYYDSNGNQLTATSGTLATVVTDVTASAADVNAVADLPTDAEFVVGAEAAHVIITTVQLEDADDANLAAAVGVHWWLSGATTGVETTDDPTSTTVIGGGVSQVLSGLTHGTRGIAKTAADGSFTVQTTQTGAKNYYLNVLLPNGKIKQSTIIAHAG